MDAIVIKHRTPQELLESFAMVYRRLIKGGLFPADRECNFSTRPVT